MSTNTISERSDQRAVECTVLCADETEASVGSEPENVFRSRSDVDALPWERVASWVAAQGHSLSLPLEPLQFSGGLANCNYLVKLDGIDHVFRCAPPGPLPKGANDMAREHRILNRLWRRFPAAPKATLYCADTSIIGRPFILSEYRRGVVIRESLPAALVGNRAACRRLATDMIALLAQLHALDPREAGLEGLGRPEGMVSRQARNWTKRAFDAFGGALPPPLLKAALWLERRAPCPQRTSVLHCDFKLNNLVLSPQSYEPIAVLDWDMGTTGDPLFDVATLLSYWTEPDDHPAMLMLNQMPTMHPGFPSRAEALEIYSRLSGIAVDAFSYYRVLALFKLCVVFQQLYVRHQRSSSRDARAAEFPKLVDGLIDFTAHTLSIQRL